MKYINVNFNIDGELNEVEMEKAAKSAYNSLTVEQKEYIEKECNILHPKIDTIEIIGGGSARCMMAELF